MHPNDPLNRNLSEDSGGINKYTEHGRYAFIRAEIVAKNAIHLHVKISLQNEDRITAQLEGEEQGR